MLFFLLQSNNYKNYLGKVSYLDETIKCIFLLIRYPSSEVIDGVVTKIFSIDIYSEQAKYILKHTKNSFGDFRNKYNDGVVKLVNDYKNLRYSLYFLYLY